MEQNNSFDSNYSNSNPNPNPNPNPPTNPNLNPNPNYPNPNYKFKYEYENNDSPVDRYLQKCKEKREQDIKMGKILTSGDYDKIKNIIRENFEERNESEKLTSDFIKCELAIVIKHVKIKHSHHMDSYYSTENFYKIKRIVGNKYT